MYMTRYARVALYPKQVMSCVLMAAHAAHVRRRKKIAFGNYNFLFGGWPGVTLLFSVSVQRDVGFSLFRAP